MANASDGFIELLHSTTDVITTRPHQPLFCDISHGSGFGDGSSDFVQRLATAVTSRRDARSSQTHAPRQPIACSQPASQTDHSGGTQ